MVYKTTMLVWALLWKHEKKFLDDFYEKKVELFDIWSTIFFFRQNKLYM